MKNSGNSSAIGHVTAPLPRRFRLEGPSVALAAGAAVRADLADIEVADRVFAPHYAKAAAYHLIAAASLHEAPSTDAPLVVRIARGTAFAVLDITGGWAWGKTGSGDVGYLPFDIVEPA